MTSGEEPTVKAKNRKNANSFCRTIILTDAPGCLPNTNLNPARWKALGFILSLASVFGKAWSGTPDDSSRLYRLTHFYAVIPSLNKMSRYASFNFN